ncbi:hypothetical protein PROVRETT_09113 [Providencia rettgeri DSM 1131]|nr:hypothetical protein PROVRETT_09113 [Providencia rettgeri DSM 1131]
MLESCFIYAIKNKNKHLNKINVNKRLSYVFIFPFKSICYILIYCLLHIDFNS